MTFRTAGCSASSAPASRSCSLRARFLLHTILVGFEIGKNVLCLTTTILRMSKRREEVKS